MAHHNHTTEPIVMNTPMGHLRFRQSYTYNAPANVPGPDTNQGHINNVNGQTVIVAPMPRDDLQDVVEHRADAPAPTISGGQEGRLIKDLNTDLVPVVEPETSSDSTAGLWMRSNGVSGKIKF